MNPLKPLLYCWCLFSSVSLFCVCSTVWSNDQPVLRHACKFQVINLFFIHMQECPLVEMDVNFRDSSTFDVTLWAELMSINRRSKIFPVADWTWSWLLALSQHGSAPFALPLPLVTTYVQIWGCSTNNNSIINSVFAIKAKFSSPCGLEVSEYSWQSVINWIKVSSYNEKCIVCLYNMCCDYLITVNEQCLFIEGIKLICMDVIRLFWLLKHLLCSSSSVS